MTGRPRILSVDDNEDTLELIRASLSDDYDVVTLSNPMDVYELIELFEPDLLIVDVMMPKITGFQLIEMMQRRPGSRQIPIILLSAKDNARDIKHGYRMGASLYLTKPFSPDRLVKNVKTQFEVHPPAPDKKRLSMTEIQNRLEMKKSFKSGLVQISTDYLKEKAVNIPKRQVAAHRPASEKTRKPG